MSYEIPDFYIRWIVQPKAAGPDAIKQAAYSAIALELDRSAS